jgi:hypothetical protein
MTDNASDEPQAITPTEADNSEPSCQTEDIDTEAEFPQTILNLLSDPPVLPHESEEAFFALFDSFQAYAKPETIIEWHLVYAATVCRWEGDRYRFMAIAVTTNQQQAGLASLFEQTGEVGIGKVGQHLVSAQARKNAMKCFSDSDYREQAYIDFEKRGYMPDGQAFRLSLPDLATIERLLSSSEKRYAVTMKDLEKRMASRAAKPAPK